MPSAEQLSAMIPESTLDELRRNNQDLIAALDDLKRQKEQLLLLNAELQETNRGVMALYNELSDELEQTNRGVVALYGELDEKSEQLRAASESKDRFWANVSHELRTPLNSDHRADPAARRAGWRPRLRAAVPGGADQELATGTLLTLVNDLLDVAKAESGQLVLDPAEVSLPALLATLRGLTRPMAEGKPVNVVVSDDGAPATILTDEIALTAILRNLLSNAIKYTDSGEVRLTVRTSRTGSRSAVSDTGTGIPAGPAGARVRGVLPGAGRQAGRHGTRAPYARRLARLLGGELTLASEAGHGNHRRAQPAARAPVRRHGRGRGRRRGLPPGAEGDADRHRRPPHRGRGRRTGARHRRRGARRPGARRPGNAWHGREHAAGAAARRAARDRHHRASTSPAPPRAAALLRKDDSPGSGWRSPSGASARPCDDRRSSRSLLLVDDDEAKRYVLATWLRRAGHTVDRGGHRARGARPRSGPPSWYCST